LIKNRNEMKNCTDLKQSKDLSKFLSFESADMCFNTRNKMPPLMTPYGRFDEFYDISPTPSFLIPCWSLTALMDVLDRGAVFKTPKGWACQTYIEYKAIISDYYNNPIDACVAMIENLHEQNLL